MQMFFDTIAIIKGQTDENFVRLRHRDNNTKITEFGKAHSD